MGNNISTTTKASAISSYILFPVQDKNHCAHSLSHRKKNPFWLNSDILLSGWNSRTIFSYIHLEFNQWLTSIYSVTKTILHSGTQSGPIPLASFQSLDFHCHSYMMLLYRFFKNRSQSRHILTYLFFFSFIFTFISYMLMLFTFIFILWYTHLYLPRLPLES